MRSITFITLLSLFATGLVAQSLSTTLTGQWDDDDLPSAFYGSFNEVWGYTDCDGNEYAIIGSSAYVHFIDLSDPTQPEEIARFEGGSTTIWRDMKTYQDHVYSVCDGCNEGMMIFDLSNLPNEVIKVDQTTEFFGSSHNIYIDEDHGRLYAAGTNTTSFGLVVLDLATNPDTPTLLGAPNLDGGYIHDLYVRDNTVYANSAGNGLFVYDFTDAEVPTVLGTMTDYDEQGYNHSCWLNDNGDYLVMIDETHGTGIKMVDVSDFSDIHVTSIFRSTLLAPDFENSVAHNPTVRGNYILISYYHDGMQVYDMTDPEDVELAAYYDTELDNTNYNSYTGNWGVYPWLPSGLVLASDMNNGLHVFSLDDIILDPTFPATYPDVELAFYDTTVCEGSPVDLIAVGEAKSWEWMNFDAVLPDTDNPVYTTTEAGLYSVLASNDHCSILTDEVEISNLPSPDVPSVEFIDNVLSTPDVVASYQWYFEGTAIPGATEMTFNPLDPGVYQLEVTNDLGCSVFSEEINVFFVSSKEELSRKQFTLSPVPATDFIRLDWSGEMTENVQYLIRDLSGRVVQSGEWSTAAPLEVSINDLAAGLYLVTLQNEKGTWTQKMEKM